MSGSARWLLSLALLLAACTPTASGPLLPRPTPPPDATTSTVAPTTTTVHVASAALAASAEAQPECPSAFCVIYNIEPSAEWSDGSPVTAADFSHTATVLDEVRVLASVDEIDEDTVRVVFDEPYGAWQTLFERVYRDGRPADSIVGVDTTGPFVFDEWAQGEYLVLQRDPDWWATEDPLTASRLGDVQRIRFVFIETLDEMLDALESGEVDVVTGRPDQASVERLEEMEGARYVLEPGPFWEHIDFHHGDPILSQSWAREAITLAIDRQAILDETVRLVDPEASSLDNTIWMAGTPGYEPHFEDAHDIERAEEILIDNGCERGQDGVHVCQGERMSFKWASTNDDPARRAIFESTRDDLAEVGIELVGDFKTPSDFVTRDFLFGGPDQWQLINFSWRARQDPMSADSTYYCDEAGELNVNRYCSEDVERLILEAATITDPGQRAGNYNRADRMYLEDQALIPLYQKQRLMAWSSEITGPEPNYSLSGDLWNVAAWAGKEEVVVALPSEPAALDPRSQADDEANVILGALLYGAFGMDSSHQQIPVLVDRVELVTDTR